MQGLSCKAIETDEIWTFVQKKQKRLTPLDDELVRGDQYVFVAIDPDTKLVPAYTIGKRSGLTALEFMWDLRNRVKDRFQLTTDQYVGYFSAVDKVFGANIDYAQLRKVYHGNGDGTPMREGYSPSDLLRTEIESITGKPLRERISTSYIERQNLTMRMQLRRFTRLTNGFSKKLENLRAALALHFYYYNFVRTHQSIRMTPAMKAGITNRFWGWSEVLN
ncbi:MAG: IS1 family transposase [candidate division Zixibacteria bacterium]|nr:IS1 family transposase [candidate division Zixibacteria bacterium]